MTLEDVDAEDTSAGDTGVQLVIATLTRLLEESFLLTVTTLDATSSPLHGLV